MFETCSKRCMVFGTLVLGIVTVVVLILESQLADTLSGSQRIKNKTFPTENNSTCWIHQPYTVISECHPCSEFEIRSKSIGVCIHTSFKEILKCENGETVTRSDYLTLENVSMLVENLSADKFITSIEPTDDFICSKFCDRVAFLEERAFWKFTAWTFILGTVSALAVMLRMRVLNHKAKRRIRQMLNNGSI